MKEEHGIQQRLAEFIGRETEYWDFWGIIRIVKGGNILWETSRGYANAEFGVRNTMSTRFTIASVTKQFMMNISSCTVLMPASGMKDIPDTKQRKYNNDT